MALLFAFCTLAVGALQSQTYVWDGGHPGQDNWSLNQNWNPNGSPANDGTADLVFSGTVRLTPDANGGWSVNSITFDSFAGAFTIIGSTVTVQGTSVSSAIANNSSFASSITVPLVLGSTQTWTANMADLAFSGTVSLGANTLTVAGAANTAVSGTLSGTGALVKTGAGTLSLTGTNTYSGGTTVSGGTLVGTTSSLQGNIVDNAAVTFDQSTAGSFAGVISGSGSLTKQNSGTVTLLAANTYTGATTIAGGTLELGVANAVAGTTAVSIAAGGTLQLSAAAQIGSVAGAGNIVLGANTLTTGGTNASTTFAGVISGAGGFIKNGSGTLILAGANTYSGGTTIGGGTLQGSSTSLQGNIANSGAIVFDQSFDGTFAGVISGSGTLTKQSAGTLTLAGANTYSGATTISGGTLLLGAANALANTNAVSIASGATLQLGATSEIGSFAGAGSIALGSFALTSGGTGASTTFAGAISGTGGLVKSGAGNLTLSGTNTYSGGTTVSGGTLTGTDSSVQGAIVNNAAVVFDQATNGTYAGAMSGTGSLTKQNTGSLVLAGTNTYSGGTVVSGGVLQGTTNSLQGDVANQATVVFDQTGSGTYAGAMSGTGELIKQNSGTVILTGANIYSGGTVISGGTLQGSTTSLQGNITNDASLVFDQAAAGTYAGVIAGTGSLTKQNSGDLTLTGANTYSGGTTVTGGTLIGSTASLQGDITNNAAVTFDQSSTGTYASSMGGTGLLAKTNSGTLILSGTNTYSGGTTVSGGTLQGTTASLQGNITNNAAVVFDQSGSGTYAGVMAGTGSLTKQNTGTVTLSGANIHSGATAVNGGTLALGADNALSSASNLTLSSGTTLDLAGHSAQVATFDYHTAIIDFGATASANVFLFTGGGASTGTLTVNNFDSAGGDRFAFQTGALGVDAGYVSGVYFYGIGGGILGATGQTLSGYAGTWDLITPNTAAFTTWDGGSGANSNWTTQQNWAGNNAPVSGFTLKVAFDGSTRLAPSLDASYNLNTLRFDATAGAFTLGGAAGNALTFGGSVPSIIQLSANAQTVTVPLVFNSTTIVETSGAGTLELGGTVSDAGGINKVGANTLVLSGANTFTGTTSVNAGTLVLRHATGLGATSAGTSVSGGATLQLENNISVGAEALALDGTLRNASGANAYAGAISGNGGVTVDGGSLALTGTSANTYTGSTTVNAGTLDLGKTAGVTAVAGNLVIGNGAGTATARLLASNQIADTSAVTLNAAGTPVFNLNGYTEAIGSLASANAAAAVQLGAGSLTTGGDNTTTTFAGVISGSGTLTKEGSGAFTLSGTNTYTGATTIAAGMLVVQNASALGGTAGGTTVNAGATLQLENNVGIGAEALALNGALVNAAGTNSYAGAISGTGTVTVNGGSLEFGGTAANSYSGTTFVNSGTLDLNKSSGITAIAGNLVVGGGVGAATTRWLASNQIADTSAVALSAGGTPGLNLNNFSDTIGSLASANSAASVQLGTGQLTTGGDNSSTTFAGVISGAGGALIKTGSGTMTLTGANTYGAGTTVSGGVLQGTTASLQGAITNNAAVVFDQTTTGTYAGAMSGTGSLTKQNTGTLVLSGTNSYTGGTTVSGGTLQGTTSSLQGAITNNAAVIFDQTTTGTYAGVMSGSGSLTKQNTGTVILTGANSYSGGTTVSGGTLQGTTTSLQGAITNQGSVVFDQSANGTYAGAMSGSGSLTKQNSGTLTLTGANTYAGGTTVTGGTLQGSTTSLQGNIVNQSAVVFDQASNGTYAGVMSGSGSLTKQNTGTLTLTGANTYTGGTTVGAGKLALGASNALSNTTNLTLAANTTFSLNGTFSQQLGLLNSTSATIDFGPTGTANYFLLGNVGTTTGLLTISNWTSGSDVFGVATAGVSQSFLDSIYFTGINVGVGAVLSATAAPVGSYGSFYTLTPIPTFTWSGGQNTGLAADMDNWSKGNNWVGGIAPGIAAVKSLIMAGSVQTTNDMDGAYQIKGMLFRSDAGSFVINSSTGDALTVGGAGIMNQSASTQTLNVSVALSASQTWTAASGNLLINGATLLNNANTLTIDGGYNTTINAAIGSGSGGIVKTGSGTLTLGGANTFTGGVAVNAGTVAISSDANLGASSGTLGLDGGTLRTTGSVTSSRTITLGAGGGTFDSNGFNSTASGVVSGAGGLTKTGAGTLALTGANTFTGGTTIAGGTVAIAADSGLGAASGGVTFNGGTLQATAAVTSARAITLNAGGGTFDSNGFTSTMSGVISGTGALTKSGAGTLVVTGANTYSGGTTISGGTLQGSTTSLQGNIMNQATLVFDQSANGTYAGVISGTGSLTKQNSGILTLSGLNTYTGATNVTGGTLVLGLGGALSSTTALTVGSSATLDVNSVTQTIGSLAGPGIVALGSGHLSVGANNTNTTFAGLLTGTGVLDKIGSGTLTFGASFSFGGELKLTGGTIALAGINLTVGTLRISGNTTLDFGNSTASILSATNVIIENGANLTINNWVDLQDFFYATGALFGLNTSTNTVTPAIMNLRGAAPQNQILFSGFSNTTTVWQSYDSQITPTPEPAIYGLGLMGAALVIVGLRRRRQRTGSAGVPPASALRAGGPRSQAH